MNELAPIVQRTLALLLLLLLLTAVAAIGVAPVVRFYSDKYAETRALRDQVARYHRLIASREDIQQQYDQLQAMGGSSDMFLQGGKSSIVSANLQDFVNGALQRHQCELISSQEFQAQPLLSATGIGLRLQIAADLPALVALLYELETARPLVFIDNLTISSGQQRVGGAQRPVPNMPLQLQERRLMITMDVVGYQEAEKL